MCKVWTNLEVQIGHSHHVKVSPTNPDLMTITLTLLDDNYPLGRQTLHRKIMMILRTLLLRRYRISICWFLVRTWHANMIKHILMTPKLSISFQKRRVLRGKCGRYMSVHNATNASNEEFGDIDRAVFTANFCRVLNYPKMSLSILVLQMHNSKINKTRKNKDLKWFAIDFWKDFS